MTTHSRSRSGGLLAKFQSLSVSFDIELPNGEIISVGRELPAFRVIAKTARAVRALQSFDELIIMDVYLSGEIDLVGPLLKVLETKQYLRDFHPLLSIWRFIQPLFLGQTRANKRLIASHYDRDPEFFLQFLDPEVPIYTQGMYVRNDDTLAAAATRKFAYCYEACSLRPGSRMLEIGPGWGAWLKYASERGVDCTALSISKSSITYLEDMARRLKLNWKLIFEDILTYTDEEKYDAIVLMGVIEHLPDYRRVLQRFLSLLKPGGYIFVDGSACGKKYELSSAMIKYVFPGNHSLLILHDFLKCLAKTPLQVRDIFNDRASYYLTFRQWALNLTERKEHIINKFGTTEYRLFEVYLWSAAYQFLTGGFDCYRMTLYLPRANEGVPWILRGGI